MQFCRIYTGADGRSHFEDFDQREGSKYFLAGLDTKTLVFKNDMNRNDLHGCTTRRAASGALPFPAASRSASATAL